MLIHADGIDFRVLKPTSLAVGLFVALPALFGAVIGVVVDRVSAIPVLPGWRRWGLPTVLVATFPLAIVILGIAAVVLAVWVPVRRAAQACRPRRSGRVAADRAGRPRGTGGRRTSIDVIGTVSFVGAP